MFLASQDLTQDSFHILTFPYQFCLSSFKVVWIELDIHSRYITVSNAFWRLPSFSFFVKGLYFAVHKSADCESRFAMESTDNEISNSLMSPPTTIMNPLPELVGGSSLSTLATLQENSLAASVDVVGPDDETNRSVENLAEFDFASLSDDDSLDGDNDVMDKLFNKTATSATKFDARKLSFSSSQKMSSKDIPMDVAIEDSNRENPAMTLNFSSPKPSTSKAVFHNSVSNAVDDLDSDDEFNFSVSNAIGMSRASNSTSTTSTPKIEKNKSKNGAKAELETEPSIETPLINARTESNAEIMSPETGLKRKSSEVSVCKHFLLKFFVNDET